MKFLSGLKQAFTTPALKKSAMAFGGGGAVGLAHLMLSKQVEWMTEGEYAYAKRAGAAALLGLLGGALVKGKSSEAASGMQGAMGAVIAYELYNKFSAPADARYKFNGLLSDLARTNARQLNGTNVRDLNGLRGVGSTSVRSAAAARFL